MVKRRHLLVLLGITLLLLPSHPAGAGPGDVFSAAIAPTDVKPGTHTYTMTLTNSVTSQRADHANIGIPPGFTVDLTSVTATTSATNGCASAQWQLDNSLTTSERVSLEWPGGNDNRLCPGATLTVTFAASADEATYTLVPELARGEGELAVIFTLTSPPPSVRVDGTPPSVAITQTPSNPSNSSAATFGFTATEPAVCKLDGGAFSPCTSPQSHANLPDGTHTFTVAATDAAGNTAEASYSWTVETRAPTASLTSRPAALTNSRSATFAFAADEPSSFQCQLDGGAFLPCGSPASYQGLAEGTHTFAVRPTDAVGNAGNVVTHTWRIDATPPETTLLAKPGARTALASATFRFSRSEGGSFQCQLDGRAYTACTSPTTYRRLPRGTHKFSVQAVDAVGNIDPTPATHRWTIASAARTAVRSALFAPTAGARVIRPPVLRWRAIRRATYYNVQLYRAGRKVLTAWPTRTRLGLRTQWRFNGKVERLRPGLYRWYVWPGYGRAADRRYGRLVGTSTFVVATSTR